jgi:hypothetical protein
MAALRLARTFRRWARRSAKRAPPRSLTARRLRPAKRSLEWLYTLPVDVFGSLEVRVIVLLGVIGGGSSQRFALGRATLAISQPPRTTETITIASIVATTGVRNITTTADATDLSSSSSDTAGFVGSKTPVAAMPATDVNYITTTADATDVSSSSSDTAGFVGSKTPVAAMPATQAYDDKIFSIAGIVGGVVGIVALLIVVGLIVWLVARQRRAQNQSATHLSNQKGAPMPLSSNYGKVSAPNEYDESFLKHAPKTNYDASALAINNYDVVRSTDPNYENSNFTL